MMDELMGEPTARGSSIFDDYEEELGESSVDEAELMTLLGRGFNDSAQVDFIGADTSPIPSPNESMPPSPRTGPPEAKEPSMEEIKEISFDLLQRSRERAERSTWFQSKASDMQNRKL